MTVMFIVFILAIPVYLIGTATKNKIYTIVVAIIMGIIAANTGSPKYLFIDLIGIGIALFVTFAQLNNQRVD